MLVLNIRIKDREERIKRNIERYFKLNKMLSIFLEDPDGAIVVIRKNDTELSSMLSDVAVGLKGKYSREQSINYGISIIVTFLSDIASDIDSSIEDLFKEILEVKNKVTEIGNKVLLDFDYDNFRRNYKKIIDSPINIKYTNRRVNVVDGEIFERSSTTNVQGDKYINSISNYLKSFKPNTASNLSTVVRGLNALPNANLESVNDKLTLYTKADDIIIESFSDIFLSNYILEDEITGTQALKKVKDALELYLVKFEKMIKDIDGNLKALDVKVETFSKMNILLSEYQTLSMTRDEYTEKYIAYIEGTNLVFNKLFENLDLVTKELSFSIDEINRAEYIFSKLLVLMDRIVLGGK